ncbi:MAG: parallel beta-helix domain-containing protein [Woeseiaceae bacterium]|nr:parallel beta-helix domain-containing protein [Woeseiaceae bacterium]
MSRIYIIFYVLLLGNISFAEVFHLQPGKDAQQRIQEAMILAKPGDTIQLDEGVYRLTDGLSLAQNEVTVQGKGMETTILDFSNQLSGAQGILVSSDEVILRDFAVINASGDAIKVLDVDGIYMINLRVEWTNGPATENGAYGLYPVQSKNVYIEGCIAIGASDAGIYVGQSENIIVKNNSAMFNVAGIEIENSYYADVFGNTVTRNTGGILVFDLPDLPQQGGHHIRVYNNKSFNNNTDNFAPEGNIVATVPRGTGMLILANSIIEVFNNDFFENDTVNLAIVSYFQDTTDKNYYPHPRSVYIHNNRFKKSGASPDIESNELARMLYQLAENDMPDIFWDGLMPIEDLIFGQPDEERIMLGDNGDASLIVLDPFGYYLPFVDPINRNYQDYYQDKELIIPEIEINLPQDH